MNSFHSHINLVPRKTRVRYKKYTISFNINIFTIHFSSKIFCSLPIMPRDCRRVLQDHEANPVSRRIALYVMLSVDRVQIYLNMYIS